jgi:hypothetical protein
MPAEREWWRRAVLVLLWPGEVFRALDDDTVASGNERQDAVVALAFAGGVAAGLAAAPAAFGDLDALETFVWVFVTGLAYGFVGYWLLGWAISFVIPRLGGGGTRRRARHVLAFALAPLLLAIPAWLVWEPLLAALGVWSVGLLVLGLRKVYGWSWVRSLVAVAVTAVWLGALAVGVLSFLALLGRGFE